VSERALTLDRAAYVATQGARVAWYSAHYLLARRLSGPITPQGEPAFRPKSRAGDGKAVRDEFLTLFAQDRANIEAGLYPAPDDFSLARLPRLLAHSRAFFADLPAVDKRRLARRGAEVRESNEAPIPEAHRYPAYYLQNFHYQTGGWLTRESARLYDTQVETLFAGAGDAMRRVGLALLLAALRGRDQRTMRLLDVACGNGRFLREALRALPRLNASGLDLSPAYIEEARTRLAPWRRTELAVGAAEALPFDDGTFDAASSIYLFHELPPRVRREAAREIARVLKPGGLFLFVDSIQAGETPALDQMLEYFPIGFHEPYYGSYQQENLAALFGAAGLDVIEVKRAFLSKAILLRKPG
jgi:ubiquinone/menaquinone biosynthesis C-methylase UbiE